MSPAVREQHQIDEMLEASSQCKVFSSNEYSCDSTSIPRLSTLIHQEDTALFESNCIHVMDEVLDSLNNGTIRLLNLNYSKTIPVIGQSLPYSSKEGISEQFMNSDYQDTSNFDHINQNNNILNSNTNGYNWFNSNQDFIPSYSVLQQSCGQIASNQTILQSYDSSNQNQVELNRVDDPSILSLLLLNEDQKIPDIPSSKRDSISMDDSNVKSKFISNDAVKTRRDRNKVAAVKCREKRKEIMSEQKKRMIESQTNCEEIKLRIGELNEANSYCRFMLNNYFGGL